MVIVTLPSGLVCWERDLHHLSWIAVDLRKKDQKQPSFFGEAVLQFLAIPHAQQPVAAGTWHTCAVQADGKLVCFGDNCLGQCDVPADLGPITSVAAGTGRTCAVQADGKLVCLGLNDFGTERSPQHVLLQHHY